MSPAEKLELEFKSSLTFSAGLEAGRRALVETAATELYAAMGRDSPALIWCASPYQMAVLPSLLIGMFFSDAWQVVFHAFNNRPYNELWQRDYETAWNTLWAHGGQQLLKGMKATSRIASLYWELEGPLYKQCKEELAYWLRSGKLPAFEEKLPKQIVYRQFWAMHLWHLNAVQDRLRLFGAELARLLHSQDQIYRQEWKEFLPLQDRLLRTYADSEASITGIVSRMGAEPANQLKHCSWLPISIPALKLSWIWRNCVDPEPFKPYERELDAWIRLSQNCFGLLCLDNVVFACEKPEIFAIDDSGRLHCESGPAFVFADGFSGYAWHGVFVERGIIEEPEAITVAEIESCANAELRRVLIERYGPSRYIIDSGAEEVSSDECGTLYKKEVPGDEALVFVKVKNSTPEPDGQYRDYFLRVPPEISSARQAVAWTFALETEDYNPLVET